MGRLYARMEGQLSPPAPYNFAEIPSVRSRRPLWDEKYPDKADWKQAE